MAYIIFDMEWNQPMSKDAPRRGRGRVKLTGEIIQIGAVKMSEDCDMLGTFSSNVSPRFYKRLNTRVKKLTGITNDELEDAPRFPEVIKKFIAFCGENPVMLTWGSDDMPIMRQNLAVYGLDSAWCENSFNLQSIFAAQAAGESPQRSLSSALELMGIEAVAEAHNAMHDAYHTALIAKRLDLKKGIRDYGNGGIELLWEHPLSEETVGGITARQRAASDVKLIELFCPMCGGKMAHEPLVLLNGGKYIASAHCKEHGDYIVRYRFTRDGGESFILTKTVFRASKFGLDYYNEHLMKKREKKQKFVLRMKKKREQKPAEKTTAEV